MSSVKFVYFDLGGVLMTDFSGNNKWDEMKKIMGVSEADKVEFDKLYDKYELEDLCLSRNVDTLIPIFKERFGLNLPENFSMLNYFLDHFEANNSIWSVVKLAKSRFKIGIITNMYLGMFDVIKARNLLPPVEWDVIVDSTIVKLQKPDPKIYELAAKMAGVKNEEIFFVDNRMNNIEGARSKGWNTFFYDSSDESTSSKLLNDALIKLS